MVAPVDWLPGNGGLHAVLVAMVCENEGWSLVDKGWFHVADTWLYGYVMGSDQGRRGE